MITCVGDLVTDIVVQTHEPFHAASDTAATISRHRGGSAANVAELVAADGGEARFVGNVGADQDADLLIQRLLARGVDVSVTRRGRTGTLVVVVTADGERHFYTDRAACTDLAPMDPGWLADTTVLHLPLYSFSGEPIATTARQLVAEAARREIPITVDLSSTAVIDAIGIDAVLDLVATIEPLVVFANADEARVLDLGPNRPAPHTTTTVVRNGGIETHIVDRTGHTATVAVPPVDRIVDTTGAGDGFAAGWLRTIVPGATTLDAAAAAHRLAASVLAHPGAQLGTEVT